MNDYCLPLQNAKTIKHTLGYFSFQDDILN